MQQPDAIAGTVGGTVLVIIMNAFTVQVVHTALLAAIGAVVSYLVSMGLDMLIKKGRRKK
ncbi:hypothetical protein BH11BAC4_BH11BAC4_18770 [soil metagenome]